MAAPMRLTFTKLRFLKKTLFKLNIAPCSSSYSTLSEESKELEVDIEEEINRLRDVSNMAPRYKQKMTARVFDMEQLRSSDQFSRAYLRKMYAMYGQASGIDPAIIWPSEEELEELVDIEENWTETFQDMTAKIENRKAKHKAYLEEREKNIDKAMAKMPKLIAEYKAQQQKKVGLVRQMDAEEEEEIRDQFIEYFGYEPTKNSKFTEFERYVKYERKLQKKKEKKESKRDKKAQKIQKEPVESAKA